jgi:hypothetical protein
MRRLGISRKRRSLPIGQRAGFLFFFWKYHDISFDRARSCVPGFGSAFAQFEDLVGAEDALELPQKFLALLPAAPRVDEDDQRRVLRGTIECSDADEQVRRTRIIK